MSEQPNRNITPPEEILMPFANEEEAGWATVEEVREPQEGQETIQRRSQRVQNIQNKPNPPPKSKSTVTTGKSAVRAPGQSLLARSTIPQRTGFIAKRPTEVATPEIGKIASLEKKMGEMALVMNQLLDTIESLKPQQGNQETGKQQEVETPKAAKNEIVAQPTVIVQQVTPLTPPKFNGNLDESLGWLMSYKEASTANNWTEDIRIKQVCQSLEYAARSWYRTTWRAGLPATWQEFEDKFKEAFVSGTAEDYLRLKLAKLKQREDQTLLEYYHKALEDCILGDETLSDHIKIAFIIDGMAQEPRSAMRLLKPKTIRDLQENVNNYMKDHPGPPKPRRKPNQGQERDTDRKELPEKERWCICCGKQGHFARGCTHKQDEETIRQRKAEWRENPPWRKPKANTHRANVVNVETPPLEENTRTVKVQIKNMDNINDLQTKSVKIKSLNKPDNLTKIKCRINGLLQDAIIDTGATVTVIPLEVALATNTDLYEWTYKDLELADGTLQKPLAQCKVSIEYRDRIFTVTAVVLVDAPDILLGEDYLDQASMVISYPDRITTYHDRFMKTVSDYQDRVKPKTQTKEATAKEFQKASGSKAIKAKLDQDRVLEENWSADQPPTYYIEYPEDTEERFKLRRINTVDSEVAHIESLVKAKKKTLIPPRTAVRTQVKITGETNKSGAYMMEPHTTARTAFIPGIGRSNASVVDIYNISDEPLTIERHQQLGKATPLSKIERGENNIAVGTSLTDEQKAQLNILLKEHEHVFTNHTESIGIVPFMEHSIDTGDSKPIRSKPYRVSIKEQQVIQNLVNEMLESDIIRPSKSPWASPIVLVKKRGTDELRFCVDYRKLNKETKLDPYPIPNMDQVLETLSGNHFFSKLDIKAMYWQVKMEESSREKTAFVVHCGQYEFNVMPFGLVSAPMTAMRVMNQVTNGMEDRCFVFYDDILVFTRTFEAHLAALKELFERLDEANIKLNKAKCSLLLESVQYLGHIVTPGGIEPDPDKIKAIQKVEKPKSLTEARSFFGMCNFYRRYIKGFADIARPISDALKKPFTWTDEATQAMDKLKKKLTSAPLLVHFCPQSKLTIRCDASGYGLGAVLLQENENPKFTGVIAYTSRTLSKSEKNYATTHKECLAVVHSVTHWRHYLYGTKFTIITDHHALCWLMKQEKHTGQLMRWSLILSDFKFDIIYESGKQHLDADCLSRNPIEAEGDTQEEELPTWPIHDLSRSKSTAYTVNIRTENPIQPIYDVQEEQSKDPQISEIIRIVGDPHAYSKQTKKKYKTYILEKGILYKASKQNKSKLLLVLPQSMVKYVLEETHDRPTGGHFGSKKTINKIKQRFYWKSLDEDVKSYIASCDKCQRRKTNYNDKPGLMIPMSIPRRTFEKIGMDILGPLPKSNRQNVYILVITDYLSKYVIAQPMKKATTQKILEILKKHVFYVHGIPKRIVTDNGTNLTSRPMRELLETLGINHKTTCPYRPQTNGQTERYNRVLGTQLSIFASEQQRTWDEYLDALTYAYNTIEHTSTLATPYYLVFGKEPTLKLEQVTGRPMQIQPTEGEDEVAESDILEAARHFAKEMIELSQVRNKLRYDKKRHTKEYKIGDLVLRYKPIGPQGKLDEPWIGPFKITRKISSLNYQIESVEDPEMYHIVHITQIKPYHSRRDVNLEEGGDIEQSQEIIQNERQTISDNSPYRRENVESNDAQAQNN